ncbi:hypothetical protein FSW04_00245 [Baekduia soli]|uniref:Uncharacterized protein n=1 Tax=Baekduia soli TaxID=496014 RepID=A0A5B8TZJ7_9ACTN|nr:hypothetical protein [Baekduia soli]QEC46147.1 hypothetical protein FSW04_00245 [Baekduia soli]
MQLAREPEQARALVGQAERPVQPVGLRGPVDRGDALPLAVAEGDPQQEQARREVSGRRACSGKARAVAVEP